MSEEARSSRRIGRVLGEFSVIVLGVLVALWVDAWWESAQERRTEAEMLEALAGELDAAEETLLGYVGLDSAIVRNADILLGTPGLSDDFVAVLMNQLYYTIPRQPALPTVEEATSTGRLRLFQNPELRLRITVFTAELRTLNDYHVQTEAQWNEVARPVLYGSTDFDRLVLSGNRHWGTAGPARGPSVTAHPDSDASLRNVIRDRRAFVSVRTMLLGRQLQELDVLRGIVRAELGDG
jgi:hypothetical protein